MAIFEENRLRPEEIAGGFDRESAEDTFLLDSLEAYPGELPDMFNLSEQFENALNPPEPELPAEPGPTAADTEVSEIAPEPGRSEYLFEEDAEAESQTPDETPQPVAEPPAAEQPDTEQPVAEQPDADSVWDVFNQEQPTFDTTKEQIDFADLAEKPDAERIISDDEKLESAPTEKPDQDELLSSAAGDKAIDDDVFSSASELIDPELLMSAPTPKPEQEITESELDLDTAGISFVEEEKPDEAISNADILGDDLKSLIEQDLQRAKSRKPRENEEPAKELTDDEIRDKLSEFKAVDDSNPDVLIDLTAIHSEHPSSVLAGIAEPAQEINLFAENEEQQPTKKEKKQKKAAAPAQDEQTPVADKPKKQRKPLPWKTIGLSAAILLIAGAIGYGIYFTATETDLYADIRSGISSLLSIDTVAPADSTNSGQPAHSGKDAESETAKAGEKPSAPEAESVKKQESKPEPPKEEAKPAEKPVASEPARHQEEPQKPKKQEAAKPTPEKKADIAKPIAKSDTPKKKPAAKIKDIAQIRKEAKEGKKQISPKSKQAAAKPESRDAVYTVEVYSSPSREDAEDWVRSLSKRKVQNVFIKEQKIRDVVWYKVRFGQFQSKDEAKQTAEKHGFSHIWIDRVK